MDLSLTEKRIIVADETSGSCAGSMSKVTVRFGSAVIRLYLLVVAPVPYDLIIGETALLKMCACIEICHLRAESEKMEEQQYRTVAVFF